MIPAPKEYASMIIRLWRVCEGEPGDQSPGWHCEVEHIQSGERWEFSTPDEMERFIAKFLRLPSGSWAASAPMNRSLSEDHRE